MLEGKVAVITGGSRGIGASIAKKMAAEGCDIAVIYAGNTDKAAAICDECRTNSKVTVKSYQCDVSDFEATGQIVSDIKKDFGTIDILVNCAGINDDCLIAMMSEKSFDKVIEVNLKGTFNMIRHVIKIFMRNRSGKIINISSAAGIMGNAGQANYSASKAGVIGLTKSVAREMASRNIICNAVAPGFIETDMTKNLPMDEETMKKTIPLGRFGQPEDIADAVLFLAKSDYITGSVLCVDGGVAM